MLSIDYFKLYKSFAISYYSRSTTLYDTEKELNDILLLKSLKFKIANRYNLKYKSVIYFLNDIKNSDIVFFRGSDLRVSLEVLFSISIKKITVSLKTCSCVSMNELCDFVNVLKSNEYFSHYAMEIKNNFPVAWKNLQKLIKQVV